MSIWHTVNDKEDIAIDGEKINILFDGDDNGNIYVEIPLEVMRQVIVDHDKKEGNDIAHLKESKSAITNLLMKKISQANDMVLERDKEIELLKHKLTLNK